MKVGKSTSWLLPVMNRVVGINQTVHVLLLKKYSNCFPTFLVLLIMIYKYFS